MRKNKLVELERLHGPLHIFIPRVVNESGSAKAAAVRLGVSQSVISEWLKAHGYRLHLVYVQSAQEETDSETK